MKYYDEIYILQYAKGDAVMVRTHNLVTESYG